MDIRIKKRPVVMTDNTRLALECKIHRSFKITSHSMSNFGVGWKSDLCGKNGKYVMVNYQKFRSKRGVRKAHWIAYIYTFDVGFLQAAGLEVIQKTRHFDIMEK